MLEAVLALLGLVVGAVVAVVVMRSRGGSVEALRGEAERDLATARREADAVRKEAEVAAKEHMLAARSEVEEQLKGRSLEVARSEERLGARAAQLDQTTADVAAREGKLSERDAALGEREARVEQLVDEQQRELERVAAMTQGQAREALLARVEEQARHDVARRIRTIEDEARIEADRRVRNIISIGIQRTASAHAASTTVSSVTLPSDEMKGRIIGREGRNIRTLENLTGVDVIIDDTPGAVLLSGFDGMRREIARLTLQRLIADGRIHPARIEECYGQAKQEVEEEIVRAGEQASFDAKVPGLHPELLKVLGRLKYRTSYGQNVLSHSVEVAHVAAIMAAELGASQKTARRAALLHDVGKALTHEVEGSHAIIGAQLARKHRESAAVVHAIEAHHFEVEPQTIEAVLVQAADAISAARPGARGETMEHYAKRLEDLERIATSKPGVERCFAMQAGRDVRVMVKPDMVDDDAATILSHEIAREIEDSLEYPGQIRVTVIRELRATDVAR
jgi:ribonuclease Y